MEEGFKSYFNNKVASCWACPNYCYKCNNKAAVYKLHEDGSHHLIFFEHDFEKTA